MTIDPAQESLAVVWVSYQADQQLAEFLSGVSVYQDLSQIASSLLHVADSLDLDENQRSQVNSIFESEAPAISTLMGQMIKSRRRLLAARNSSVFNEAHEQTLVTEQHILMDEIKAAASRLTFRVHSLLSEGRHGSSEMISGLPD